MIGNRIVDELSYILTLIIIRVTVLCTVSGQDDKQVHDFLTQYLFITF